MAVIAVLYLVLSLALAAAWIATEFRSQPGRAPALEFLVAAVAWPFVLAFVVILMLATKSKKN